MPQPSPASRAISFNSAMAGPRAAASPRRVRRCPAPRPGRRNHRAAAAHAGCRHSPCWGQAGFRAVGHQHVHALPILRAGILSVAKGQREAAAARGLRRMRVFRLAAWRRRCASSSPARQQRERAAEGDVARLGDQRGRAAAPRAAADPGTPSGAGAVHRDGAPLPADDDVAGRGAAPARTALRARPCGGCRGAAMTGRGRRAIAASVP